MPAKFRGVDAGIECMEGLPGSGKSFMAVKLALEAIITDRRPVFTNLPLRWRVFRQYLRNRGGEELAGLVYELTEEHFRAFLSRSVKRTKFRAEYMTTAKGGARSEKAFQRAWEEHAGPDVVRGPGANWILPTALIVMDEVHHWFNADTKVQRSETPDLLTYLTMLRHYMHRIVYVTQDRMQVSVTFRRLTKLFWHVRDRGQDPLAWGIRCRHLGITGFAYVRMTPEAETAKGGEAARPAGQEVVWPWMPSQRWVFRLYSSYTHVGSPRALRRALERARSEAGLSVGGMLELELARQAARRERWRARNVAGFIARWSMRSGVAAAVLLLGVGFGRGIGGRAETGPVVEPVALDVPGPVWPDLGGFGPDYVRVGGKRVRVGETINDLEVLAVVRGRGVILGAGSDVFVWRVGDAEPTRVGTDDEVTDALRRRLAETGRAWGTAVPGPG